MVRSLYLHRTRVSEGDGLFSVGNSSKPDDKLWRTKVNSMQFLCEVCISKILRCSVEAGSLRCERDQLRERLQAETSVINQLQEKVSKIPDALPSKENAPLDCATPMDSADSEGDAHKPSEPQCASAVAHSTEACASLVLTNESQAAIEPGTDFNTVKEDEARLTAEWLAQYQSAKGCV